MVTVSYTTFLISIFILPNENDDTNIIEMVWEFMYRECLLQSSEYDRCFLHSYSPKLCLEANLAS